MEQSKQIRVDKPKVHLLLTDKCNLNCKHCFLGSKEKRNSFLSWPQIKTALRHYKKIGFDTAQITGGEPYLSPYFKQTVKLANKLKYQTVGISTNGTHPEIIDWFTPNEVQKISFGLDGACAKTDDYIRGKGHFNQCLSSIKKAVRKGFTVHVIFCLNKKNLKEVKKMIDLMDKLGVARLSFNFTTCFGNARKNKEILLPLKDWLNIRRRIEVYRCQNTILRIPIGFASKNEFRQISSQSHQCYLQNPRHILIYPNGDIYHCCLLIGNNLLSAGKLRENTISAKRNFKKYFKKDCLALQLLAKKEKTPQDNKILPVCVYWKKIIMPKSPGVSKF